MEPNWEWYRTFLCVFDAGSLSAAGRTMGLAQPTVGRHIDSLEGALGLKLFTRSFDGFTPTDAAHELRPYAASIASMAAALRRAADSHGEGVRGSVRITASEIIGVEVLPSILADLRMKHPQLAIELILSDEVDDLLHRAADIAIRMFRPTQEALIAKQVGRIELGFFAHHNYLAAHGTPTSWEELNQHNIIGYDKETAFIRRWQEKFPTFARENFALRTDSNLAQLRAIHSGFGIGICQTALAQRYELTRVLPEHFSVGMDTWVAMHEDLRNNARCSVTFAALVAGLASYIQGNSAI